MRRKMGQFSAPMSCATYGDAVVVTVTAVNTVDVTVVAGKVPTTVREKNYINCAGNTRGTHERRHGRTARSLTSHY